MSDNKTNKLSEKIKELIELKQEGEYWDFKRQWYGKDKKDDMLHDIICMSNNLANRDAYIIIGVDEENDYQLVGVSDDEVRKNTQNIVDFLRSKKFAGDIRPTVTVETVTIDNKKIDVIVMYNSNNTPFYLKKKSGKVRAYHIYTRVQDTNTPVDFSADINNAELLWKKRFGLLLTPLERCKMYLLDKEGWEQSEFYNDRHHYKLFPEFTIEKNYELEESRNGCEYYMFDQTNMSASWASVFIKYHQTVLFQSLAIMLDSGRYFALAPDRDFLKFTNHEIHYGYMIKSDLRYIFNDFFFHEDGDEESHAHDIYMDNILIFKNDEERLLFEEYVINNWNDSYENKINSVFPPNLPEDGLNYEQREETYRIVHVMQEMLREFRSNNSNCDYKE